MREDSWLSSQMINLMATFMALFVQMISYCAQGCILEWQTMLPKEVFIFFGRKINFPFLVPKMSFFVKELPYICCKIGPIKFCNIPGHMWCTIDQMVGCQNIWSTSREKHKIPLIQLEGGKFELQLPYSLLFIFSKNHF